MSDSRAQKAQTLGDLKAWIAAREAAGELTDESRISAFDSYGSTNHRELGGTLHLFADEYRGGNYLAFWGTFY